MSKKVLLITDIAGYGKVAYTAAAPILAHMGYDLYNLPTALVSNTLDYGEFEILDTTDYLEKALTVWDKLGFTFDAISTGFIVSHTQAEIVADFCREQSRQGVPVFADPIMGDKGKLYPGIAPETVEAMAHLCAASHTIIPNFTEATLLAERYIGAQQVTEKQASQLVESCQRMGAQSVVITSVPLETGKAVVGYDGERKEKFLLPFEEIPVRFPGTGDIFAATLLGWVLAEKPLKTATQQAMDSVYKLISRYQHQKDTYRGIPIESNLDAIAMPI